MANYNPYENMLDVLDRAAEVLGYKKEDYAFVRYPERELTVSIPIRMDDGHVEVFPATGCSIPLPGALPRVASVSIPSPMKTK